MEVVKAFNDELSHLCDTKPPVSRATMAKITKAGMKAVKFYKHVVQSVEKFIAKCRPEYKVAGLYVLDSIVRQSRHQFGAEKDVFAQRFSNNIATTFKNLLLCPDDDKIRIAKVIQLWQKSNVFSAEILDQLITCMEQNSSGDGNDGIPAITSTETENTSLPAPSVESIHHTTSEPTPAAPNLPLEFEAKPPPAPINVQQHSGLDATSTNKEDLLLSFLKIVRDTPHQKAEIDRLLKLVSKSHPHLVPQLTQLMQLYCTPNDTPPPQNNYPTSVPPVASASSNSNTSLKGFTTQNFVSIGVKEDVSVPPSREMFGPPPQTQSVPAVKGGIQQEASNGAPHISKKIFAYDYGESDDEEGEIVEMKDSHSSIFNVQVPPISKNFAHTDPKLNHENAGMNQKLNPCPATPIEPPNESFKRNTDRLSPLQVQNSSSRHRQDNRNNNNSTTNESRNDYNNRNNIHVIDDDVMITDDIEEGEYHHRRHHHKKKSRDRSPYRNSEKSRSQTSKDRRHRSRSRDRSNRSKERHNRDRDNNRERDSSDRVKTSDKNDKMDGEKQKRFAAGLPKLEPNKLCVCSTTIFIGHLSKHISEEELNDELAKYGEITTMNLIPPRGCAFITFGSRIDAYKALNGLKGSKIGGTYIKCAWAMSIGLKESNFQNLFDVEEGVAQIPWQLLENVNLVKLSVGAQIDDDSFSPQLKASYNTFLTSKDLPSPNKGTGAQIGVTASVSTLPPIQNVPIRPPLPLMPQSNIPLPRLPPGNMLPQNFGLPNHDGAATWMMGQHPIIPSYPPPPFDPRMPIQFSPFNNMAPFPRLNAIGSNMMRPPLGLRGDQHEMPLAPPLLPNQPIFHRPDLRNSNPQQPMLDIKSPPIMRNPQQGFNVRQELNNALQISPGVSNDLLRKLQAEANSNMDENILQHQPPNHMNRNAFTNSDFKSVPPPANLSSGPIPRLSEPRIQQPMFGSSPPPHPRMNLTPRQDKSVVVMPLMGLHMDNNKRQGGASFIGDNDYEEGEAEYLEKLNEEKTENSKFNTGKQDKEEVDEKTLQWRNRYTPIQTQQQQQQQQQAHDKSDSRDYDRGSSSRYGRSNDKDSKKECGRIPYSNKYDDLDKKNRNRPRGVDEDERWRGRDRQNGDDRYKGRNEEDGRRKGGSRDDRSGRYDRKSRDSDASRKEGRSRDRSRDDDRNEGGWKRKREEADDEEWGSGGNKTSAWSDYFQDGLLDLDSVTKPAIIKDSVEEKKKEKQFTSVDDAVDDIQFREEKVTLGSWVVVEKSKDKITDHNSARNTPYNKSKSEDTHKSALVNELGESRLANVNQIQSKLLQMAGLTTAAIEQTPLEYKTIAPNSHNPLKKRAFSRFGENADKEIELDIGVVNKEAVNEVKTMDDKSFSLENSCIQSKSNKINDLMNRQIEHEISSDQKYMKLIPTMDIEIDKSSIKYKSNNDKTMNDNPDKSINEVLEKPCDNVQPMNADEMTTNQNASKLDHCISETLMKGNMQDDVDPEALNLIEDWNRSFEADKMKIKESTFVITRIEDSTESNLKHDGMKEGDFSVEMERPNQELFKQKQSKEQYEKVCVKRNEQKVEVEFKTGTGQFDKEQSKELVERMEQCQKLVLEEAMMISNTGDYKNNDDKDDHTVDKYDVIPISPKMEEFSVNHNDDDADDDDNVNLNDVIADNNL